MARGASTIRSLARVFKSLDSYDGNRKVDTSEFFIGLQEVGVKLTRQESDVRKKYLLIYHSIGFTGLIWHR